MPSDIAAHRQQFPALANKVYLNYGGQGPLPRPASEAIAAAYDRLQSLGPFSKRANQWVQGVAEELRERMARELGAPPDTLTLTEDVTVGCNIPLWGLDWQAGDRVLLTDCEHPGVIAAVGELRRRFGIEIDSCPIAETLNGGDPLAAIGDRLQPRTRLFVLSHVLWNTGQVLPLASIVKLCHEADVLVLVDAAQSVGSLPLELSASGVDFYAFTGHKWWCGPAGVGGLYVSPAARERLRPTFIGWRGIEMDAQGTPTGFKPDGRRYEIATSAYPLYGGLTAAIATHQAWGSPKDRYDRLCRQSALLWQKLSQIDGLTCLKTSPPASGLVSFTLTGGGHPRLVTFLEERQIMTRTLLDPDCARACVHYFSTEAEIEALVDGIAAFLQA